MAAISPEPGHALAAARTRSVVTTRLGRFKAWWRTTVRPGWRDVQWLVVGAGALGALVLGYVGFDHYFHAVGRHHSFSDTAYRSLQLFGLDGGDLGRPIPWELDVARILAPVVAVYAAVSAIAGLLHEQLQLLRVRRMRHHVVVCGLGGRGLVLAKGFNARGDRVVVIEKDSEARGIGECREEGVIVLVGDATDRTMLRKARVHRAKYLIAVGRDDGLNAEVGADAPSVLRMGRPGLGAWRLGGWLAKVLSGRRPSVLTAFVHVTDPDLCRLLRRKEILSQQATSYRIEFFSVYEIAAHILASQYLAAAGREGDPESQHMVVVGLGQLGEALVVHAARTWHAVRGKSGQQLRVTIVDRDARRKRQLLSLSYPQIEKVCSLSEHEIEIRSPDFRRGSFLHDKRGQDASVVYVCVDDDALALAAARALLGKTGEHGVPIVVRMGKRQGLATLLDTDLGLRVFPLLDEACAPELLLDSMGELLARVIHEDYVRRQRARGETSETKPALVGWDDLDEGFKESSRHQADHIGAKLRAVGCGIEPLTDWDAQLVEFDPDEVERLARLEHKRWVEERIADGWSFGLERDDSGKVHPDLVAWEKLPEEEKDTDRGTVTRLPAFLAEAGFRLYRQTEKGLERR